MTSLKQITLPTNNVPSLTTEFVTPELASEWLAKSEDFENRKMIRQSVEIFAKAMIEGRWVLNGSTIKFDPDGICIDGQHRLMAVRVSAVPIWTAIARGVPRETYLTIDRTVSKSDGDILRAFGVKDATHVSSVIRSILSLKAGRHLSTRAFDTEEIHREIAEWPRVHEALAYAHRISSIEHSRKIVATCYLILSATEPEPGKAREFFESLATGIGLYAGHPVLALRERLIKDSASRHRRKNQIQALYLILRAWRAFIDGEQMTRMQLPKDVLTIGHVQELNPLL